MPQTFVRMIVLDVISDPNNIIDDKKVAYWSGVLKVSNIKYAYSLPRNSVIAQRINEDTNPMFVLPFFPSHLAMPCKSGECVWVMFERPDASFSDIAYWFCRTTDLHHVDDVNHSHMPRLHEPTMFPGTIDKAKETQPKYELRPGPVEIYNGERRSVIRQAYLKNEQEEIFETLVTETDAAAITNYESIPRYRKRPADISIEGSNNTLIVLGSDRKDQIASYSPLQDKTRGTIPEKPLNEFKQSAGSIDIVAGRGQKDSTSGKEVSTTKISTATSSKDDPIKKELAKSSAELSANEGDPDFTNDRSRVLISQRTSVDSNFGLSGYNSDTSVAGGSITDSKEGDAAIVLKTDKIRLIARSDIEILVTGFSQGTTPNNSIIKDENIDPKTWAAIIIKANGDIVFRPSEKGYIKLGSDNADKAVLCTDKPAIKNDGSITAKPISDTSVGFIGTSKSGQGTWARKILVD